MCVDKINIVLQKSVWTYECDNVIWTTTRARGNARVLLPYRRPNTCVAVRLWPPPGATRASRAPSVTRPTSRRCAATAPASTSIQSPTKPKPSTSAISCRSFASPAPVTTHLPGSNVYAITGTYCSMSVVCV